MKNTVLSKITTFDFENLRHQYAYVPLRKHDHFLFFIRQGAPLCSYDTHSKGEQTLHSGTARHRHAVPQEEDKVTFSLFKDW